MSGKPIPFLLFAILALARPALAGPPGLTPEQALGQSLFFDTSLSNPGGQSCGSCHNPAAAFTDPNKSNPTSAGVHATLFGFRNTPTAMYAAFSPEFGFDAAAQDYVGGQFLDGRAATLEAQAKAPFLNPVEMANPDKASVIAKLRAGPNAAMFLFLYGSDALDDVDRAYDLLAQAIASYERSAALSPFSSKYDAWLAGKTSLSAQEAHGLQLFEDTAKGNCAACHPSRPAADGSPPLFTDFTYDNIGVPRNPANPFYALPAEYNPAGAAFTDLGLGATTGDPADDGRFKVGTLRNIALTASYSHNGFFTDLTQIVDFYNTRDVKPACADPNATAAMAEALGCWPAAEFPDTVNHDELGNLNLTGDEVMDIVAFLQTLTDGWIDPAPIPEPGSLKLLAGALALAVALGRARWPASREPGR